MKYLDHKQSVETIVRLLNNDNLIPIFGSGFSANSKAKNGNVPDAKGAVEYMKKIIFGEKQQDFDSDVFSEVAEAFLNVVSKEKRRIFFESYFTKVKLSDCHKNFLSLPWTHAYTINIDDGIENNSDFTVVYPYHNVSDPKRSIKLLYKLHGDAGYEIRYDEEKNIVFCNSQYINSLEDDSNKTFIKNFIHDYKEHNLIFIGCSLNNEIDISHVYKKAEEEVSEETFRFVLRKERLSFKQEIEMKKYGVNTVLLVDDYQLFYDDVFNMYASQKSKAKADEYPFYNPKVRNIDEPKENVLKSFSDMEVFNENENVFIRLPLTIERSKLKNIEKLIEINDTVVIQGRRFSGKTSFISYIVSKYKKYSIYYFPSTSLQDEGTIKEIIENGRNSLFIFDSNSVDMYAYRYLSSVNSILKKNESKLILFINSSDNFLADSLDARYVRLKHIFDEDEVVKFNVVADKYGLLRRRNKETNIDYLQKLSDKRYLDFKFMINIPKRFSLEERVVLILLCAVDKLYTRDITYLGITHTKIDMLIKKLGHLIEYVKTGKGEKRYKRSEGKYVYNSKYCLQKIISNFTVEEVTESILYIVKSLKSTDSKRLYVEVVLFDTLNQLFGGADGSAKIIYSIYDKLEVLLNDNMDYWLQRAKSIYRRSNISLSDLENAYKYAYKAYCDGNARLRAKSALTLSLVSCLITKFVREHEYRDYQARAIEYAYEAIISEFYEHKHNFRNVLDAEKRRAYENMILGICEEVLDYCDNDLALKIGKIRKKFDFKE